METLVASRVMQERRGVVMKLGVSAFAWTAKFESVSSQVGPLVKRWDSAARNRHVRPANLPVRRFATRLRLMNWSAPCVRFCPRNQPNQSGYGNTKEFVQHLIRCIEASPPRCESPWRTVVCTIGYLPEHRRAMTNVLGCRGISVNRRHVRCCKVTFRSNP